MHFFLLFVPHLLHFSSGSGISYNRFLFPPSNPLWSEASTRSGQTGEYLDWSDVGPLFPDTNLEDQSGREEAVRYRGLHFDNPQNKPLEHTLLDNLPKASTIGCNSDIHLCPLHHHTMSNTPVRTIPRTKTMRFQETPMSPHQRTHEDVAVIL